MDKQDREVEKAGLERDLFFRPSEHRKRISSPVGVFYREVEQEDRNEVEHSGDADLVFSPRTIHC